MQGTKSGHFSERRPTFLKHYSGKLLIMKHDKLRIYIVDYLTHSDSENI